MVRVRSKSTGSGGWFIITEDYQSSVLPCVLERTDGKSQIRDLNSELVINNIPSRQKCDVFSLVGHSNVVINNK